MNNMMGWNDDSMIKSLAAQSHALGTAQSHKLNPVKWAYERLMNYIKDFEAELDDDHEIGARLVSFGQNVTFHIEDIGYHGPDIITFYGRTEETMEKVQLIQHMSQLSVLLIAVKKQHAKARRIGFTVDREKPTSNP
jgi:hypothetical protein